MFLLNEKFSLHERAERVKSALRDVGLMPSDAKKYPHQFSGGQRQRIALARALITKPAIVVLDEATSALDQESKDHVLELITSLKKAKKIAVLFIAHDLSLVQEIADRIYVMKNGKIVEHGPTRSIFSDPADAYTRELLAAAPQPMVIRDAQPAPSKTL